MIMYLLLILMSVFTTHLYAANEAEREVWTEIQGILLSGSKVYESDAYKRGLAIPLWETNEVTPFPEQEVDAHLYQVNVPTLEFFSVEDSPFQNRADRSPVILIAPGGGYQALAYQKEGVDIARRFRSLGCHTAVLKYHIAQPQAPHLAHLDALRALEILKENAEYFKIDPNAIGMAGFSAGAHLTASCLAHPGHPLAFAILIYPAYLSDDGVTIKADVVPQQPYVPTFVMQCRDDRAYVNASLGYVHQLVQANAPISYHLYSRGGHGFGGRSKPSEEYAMWHSELRQWFESIKPTFEK